MVSLLFLLDDLPVAYSFSIIHGPFNFYQSHCYTEKKCFPQYYYITNKHYLCRKNKAYGHKQQTNTVAIS